MTKFFRFLKDNSLSLTMFFLFVVFLLVYSCSGFASYNQEKINQSLQAIGYWQYLGTGIFIDGIIVNWQAAILQLTVLIICSQFMFQRGASHSRKPEEKPKLIRRKPHSWQAAWLYRNSLSITFVIMFLAMFILHIIYSEKATNTHRILLHLPPIDIGSYLISNELWANTFETWQAEFFAMWFFLIASIYMRQEYSSESKAPEADITETGEPQE